MDDDRIHLNYYIHYWNGGLAAVFGPILQKMCRVVRIKLNSRKDAQILQHLPRRQQVEELVVLDATHLNVSEWDNWKGLLRACQSELKLLDATMLDSIAWTKLHFPKLVELGLRNDLASENEHECLISRAAPNMRILKTRCCMGNLVLLLELTHRLHFLEYLAIELVPCTERYYRMKLAKVPLTYAKFASARLKKVYVSNGVEWTLNWSAEIEKVRSLVQHLFVAATKVTVEQCDYKCEKEDEEDEEFERNVEKIMQLISPKLPHANLKIMEKFLQEIIERAGDGSYNYRRRMPQILLLYDLLQIARHVNGPVMVSKELWSYLGGCLRVTYKQFLNFAKLAQYVVSNPLPVAASMVISTLFKINFKFIQRVVFIY